MSFIIKLRRPKTTILHITNDVFRYVLLPFLTWDDCVNVSLVCKAFYGHAIVRLNVIAAVDFEQVHSYQMNRFGHIVLGLHECRDARNYYRFKMSNALDYKDGAFDLTPWLGVNNSKREFPLKQGDFNNVETTVVNGRTFYRVHSLFMSSLKKYGTLENLLTHQKKNEQARINRKMALERKLIEDAELERRNRFEEAEQLKSREIERKIQEDAIRIREKKRQRHEQEMRQWDEQECQSRFNGFDQWCQEFNLL